MSVKDLTSKQAREKLAAKQDELGKVFGEAKTSDGQYDFSKVTCLGADVKGGIAVAEKVKALNDECDELAVHAETLEAAEKTASDYEGREKARRRVPMPGGKGDGRGRETKSLGELVTEEKAYQGWAQRGCAGGVDFSYSELWPSDMLAKGAAFDTLRSKALMSTTAGYAPEVLRAPGFVEMATRPIQVIDIIPMFQTSQSAYKYMEETTRSHGAAETAEGGDYAESEFAFTEKNSPVEKITDSVPVTDEQLADVPAMGGYINGRLTFGLRQRLDLQCVAGDGTSPRLRGMKNIAGIQTQAKGAAPAMDAFAMGIKKVRLTGRAMATHHLMHPDDWWDMRLTRTADGIYIFGAPTDAGPTRLWGLPVVEQDAVASGWGMVGSFQPAWISLFERQGVDIQIGYVNAQFAQGKRTVRGDMRVAFVVTRPAAFCEITGLGDE